MNIDHDAWCSLLLAELGRRYLIGQKRLPIISHQYTDHLARRRLP